MPKVTVDDMVKHADIARNAERAEAYPDRFAERKPEEHSTLDQFKAAMRTENVVGSYLAQSREERALTTSGRKINTGFNPFEYLASQGRLQDSAAVAYANSPEEVDKVLGFVDKQNEDREIVRNGSWYTTLAAVALDPTILLPGTATIKAGSLAKRVGQGIASGAALTAGSVGIQEALLHDSQTQRTIQESALALLSSAALGGVVGGIGGASAGGRAVGNLDEASGLMHKGQKNAHSGMMHEQMHTRPRQDYNPEAEGKIVTDGSGHKPRFRQAGTTEDGKPIYRQVETPDEPVTLYNTRLRVEGKDDVSIESLSASDEGIAYLNDTVVKRMRQPVGFLRNPIISGLTAKSAIARKLTNTIYNHNYELGKNLVGEATQESVEDAIKLDSIASGKALSDVDKIYLHHIGVPDNTFSAARALKETQLNGKMTREQFDHEVAQAMRNGGEHEIKAIADAARRYGKETDSILKEAQAVGLLDETIDLKTAKGYLTKTYDADLIVSDPDGFRDAYIADLVAQGFSYKKAAGEASSMYKTVTGQQADEYVVNSILRRLVEGAGSFGKERMGNATDIGISKYLKSNATEQMATYMKSMRTAIAFKKGLQSMGYETITDVQNAIRKEYSKLIRNAGSADEAKALRKEMLEQVQDAGDNAAIILGQFRRKGSADKALRNLRKVQTLASLGGVVISSLAEPLALVFRNGLGGLKPLMTANIKAIKEMNADSKTIGDLILGLELEQNNIIRNLGDPEYSLGTIKSGVDSAFESASAAFGKLSGIQYWTNGNRRLAGHLASANIIRKLQSVKAGETLSKKDTAWLASLGIGKEDYAAITQMFDAHGTKTGNSFISHFEDWTDPVSQRKFMNAIQKEVQNTVITEGRGSIPFAVQKSEVGATLFQYKTFSAHASDKYLMGAMQGLAGHRKQEVLMGLVGMVGMGMMVEALKRKMSGRDIDDIDPEGADFDDWLVSGISRAGILGLWDIPIIGLNPMFNDAKYAGQNAVGTIFGPSVGTIGRGMTVLNGIGSENETDANRAIEAGIRLLPYNNIFYLRMMMEDSNK